MKWENTYQRDGPGSCSGGDSEELAAYLRGEPRPSYGGGAVRPGQTPCLPRPFAGGGSIPLEAQRLGLEAHASDLNPVAVLINKAMIEYRPSSPVSRR